MRKYVFQRIWTSFLTLFVVICKERFLPLRIHGERLPGLPVLEERHLA
ncbi:MAG: hypothetical protein LBQ42_00030 [Synergistaceae bacterium]|nr:hypothetical protein [Synergistaceae bacterium]